MLAISSKDSLTNADKICRTVEGKRSMNAWSKSAFAVSLVRSSCFSKSLKCESNSEGFLSPNCGAECKF